MMPNCKQYSALVFCAAFVTGVTSVLLVQYLDFLNDQRPPVKYSDLKRSANPVSRQPKFHNSRDDSGLIERPITCSDSLLKPILKTLLRDDDTRNAVNYFTDAHDCRDIWEIYHVDLNNDGTKEILVRGQPCGATGNCSFWIFQRRGRRFRTVLQAGDDVDWAKMGDQVLKTRTKGFRNILLRGHFSASETEFSYLSYNGRKYVESSCLYHVPDYRSKTPKWHFITCRQFYAGLKDQ